MFNKRHLVSISYYFYLLIISLLLIASCRPAKQAKAGFRSETDTLLFAGKVWKSDSINLANYKTIKWNETFVAKPNENIDNKSVTRKNLKLIFELENGDTLCLANDTSQSDSYVNYQYCTKLSMINHWLILGYYYEWLQYEIVNCSNGKRTLVMGYPIFSPDGKYMFCGSFDESGEGTNGIEIWKLKGTSLQLALRRMLNKWGPQRVAWIANDTLLIERYFMLNPQPGYVKMGIPKE
jgi:hypothetical protein